MVLAWLKKNDYPAPTVMGCNDNLDNQAGVGKAASPLSADY
jgi:hypothetical protein